MKIMISNDGPTAHYYMRLGIARAFSAMGHDVIMWELGSKSAFDAFDEFEPHIFIGQSYNLDAGTVKCILERPYLKVIMKAGDWGSLQIDTSKYPVLMASRQEIDNVLFLKDKVNKPDFLEIHYHEDGIGETHDYWLRSGVDVQSIMGAADLYDYVNGKYRPEFASDVAFVGGYWPYKAKVLDEYLLPLCNLNSGLNVKIFGNQPWPVANYCGFVDNIFVADILASAKVCANLHEPHSQKYGHDIIERPYKLLANKSFVVSDSVAGLNKLFTEEELVRAKDAKEFEKLIRHYVANPNERLPFIEKGYQAVIAKHTYFDRVKKIFDKLKMPEQVELAETTKERFLKKLDGKSI